MDQLQEWIDELTRRQDNIDPIRRIPNGALFQGTLIKGSLRLNKPQRIGAFLLGSFSLALGCLSLAHLIAAIRADNLQGNSLAEALFTPLSLWFGWRIVMNAALNNPKRPGKD
jgi:hypothetical protein